jgi:hypothetical protein
MELRHKVLCLRSIRGHKFLRFSGFVLIACALVLMLRTSSDYYGTSDQILNSIENHLVVVDKVFSSNDVGDKSNNFDVSTSINFADPVTTPHSAKKVKKNQTKKSNETDENDQSFNIAVQPLIHQTVNILDKYMDMDSTNYQAIRSLSTF